MYYHKLLISLLLSLFVIYYGTLLELFHYYKIHDCWAKYTNISNYINIIYGIICVPRANNSKTIVFSSILCRKTPRRLFASQSLLRLSWKLLYLTQVLYILNTEMRINIISVFIIKIDLVLKNYCKKKCLM